MTLTEKYPEQFREADKLIHTYTKQNDKILNNSFDNIYLNYEKSEIENEYEI